MKSEVARLFVYHLIYKYSDYLTKAKDGKQYIDLADDFNVMPSLKFRVAAYGLYLTGITY